MSNTDGGAVAGDTIEISEDSSTSLQSPTESAEVRSTDVPNTQPCTSKKASRKEAAMTALTGQLNNRKLHR